MKIVVFVALVLAVSVPILNATPAKAQVYLLAGQSNMQGKAPLADLPPDYQGCAIEEAYFWNRQREFEPIVVGQTHTGAKPEHFGPELSFARTLREEQPQVSVYIVKYFASGKALDKNWDGPVWTEDGQVSTQKNFYPGKNPSDPETGIFYEQMRQKMSQALDAMKKSKVDYEVAAIVWVQGENDARSAVSAGRYAENLALLKRRMQDDLGLGDVPLVYAQSLPISAKNHDYRDELQTQKQLADSRSGDALSIPGAYLVPVDGVTLLPDGLHYDAAGEILLGQRLARAALQARP